MPSRAEIQKVITDTKAGCQDAFRREALVKLHKYTGRDVILYASAFTSTIKRTQKLPANTFSIALDDLQGFMAALHGLSGKSLDLIVHSPGGSLEAADQIVQYLRAKYSNIRAIVPQNAMSAATMLVCACDEVVMGKHSALGPIDPQITLPTNNGFFTAPAQAILEDFNQAKLDVKKDVKLATLWASKLRDYPPGILQICKDTAALAEAKVKTWLESYMFRGDSNKAQRAKKLASWLADQKKHKTHGRPIGADVLRQQGMNILQLEDDAELQELVLTVFHAMALSFDITPCVKMFESHIGKSLFIGAEVKA